MKIYSVGGSVRDHLLGKVPSDLDYVVVGSSPAEMIEAGFVQVGADFPVFLHPETKHEYALARTERKSGPGYRGFQVEINCHVSLETDLLRRDLSICSIAMDESGNIIDPAGGVRDLRDKILRHTSAAFSEDPLRVIRLARFASRFVDFSIAPETLELARQIVQAGGIDELSRERIYYEMEKVLMQGGNFRIFLNVLDVCGVLWGTSFFRDLLGARSAAWTALDSYLSCTALLADDLRLPAIVALLASSTAPQTSIVIPTRVKILTRLLVMARLIVPSPEKILAFLKAARAFSEGSHLCEVIELLAIAEKFESLPLRAQRLRLCHDVARTVQAADFPHLGEGWQLGEAIRGERLKRIEGVLC